MERNHGSERPLSLSKADERIAAICRENGIPEEFRPQLSIGWWKRGENASRQRRDELRKLAQARIDAEAKAAVSAIELASADVLTELIAGGLESR